MGLLLLKLIISGLTLHSWFFNEIQFKEVVPTKRDKNHDTIQNTFLINRNIFICYFLTIVF